MNEFRTTAQKESRTELSDSPTRVRRRALSILHGRATPTTERELASELAGPPGAGPDRMRSRREAHIQLRHVHLPKLADAGFVTWDEDDATVTVADHPAVYDRTFVPVDERDDDDGTDVVEDAPNGRRRTVLTVLESRDGPQERADVAREVAGREAEGEPSFEAVEEILVSLHHVHLPKLAHAGLVEYDPDEGTVSTTANRGRQ